VRHAIWNRASVAALAAWSIAAASLVASDAHAQCGLPRTGYRVPALDPVEQAFEGFLCERGIEGAVLAVMHDGVVVYQRGFGYHDEARTTPMPPDAPMRLASVSKPITAAAIRELISDGAFSLDSNAFDVGQPGGGVLPVTPFGGAPGDARLADVTIRNLLDHRGGWDRDIAGDLTYREVLIAQDMNVQSPPGRQATLEWILAQPLQHTPGSTYAYSNIGYLVLGMIVEHESGQDLVSFLHDRVFDPLGGFRSEHFAGPSPPIKTRGSRTTGTTASRPTSSIPPAPSSISPTAAGTTRPASDRAARSPRRARSSPSFRTATSAGPPSACRDRSPSPPAGAETTPGACRGPTRSRASAPTPPTTSS